MSTVEHCLLCGRPGWHDAEASRFLGLDGWSRHQIYRCRACSYRWLAPMPSAEDLNALYGTRYFEDPARSYSYDAQVAEQRPCFDRTAARIRAEAPGPRVLDVGAATGDFLAAARAQGLDALGVEYSEHACRRCEERGLPVQRGTLDSPALDGLTFDAIHMSHVFEHLPDPRAALRRISAILRPVGLLYVEVPYQFDGLLDMVSRLRGGTRTLDAWSIHHRSFFSPRSLRNLLAQNGFTVLSLSTFMRCRRAGRRSGARLFVLQTLLWAADQVLGRGDVISVWARRTSPSSD